MKLSIEKRPTLTMLNTYFVFTHGDKTFEIETNAAKSILLMWVFFSTCFFMYMIGNQMAHDQVKMTAYLLKGNLTTEDGQPIVCDAIKTSDKAIEWKCEVLNKTVTA